LARSIPLPQRDIVVIGASAGGVQALIQLVRGLPPDFPAAVFVVLHMGPSATSRLSEILSRSGPLEAINATDGSPIEPGCIVIAPPDFHLVVRPGRVELSRGPRENHTRPAIDPLFRSAARAYGNRVIGVVLSGALYDGTAGLLAIQARGGTTIVQDPQDAAVESMPSTALRLVDADHVLPAAEIGPVLDRLAREPLPEPGRATAMTEVDTQITSVIQQDIHELAANLRPHELTIYTCPDCGGTLWQGQTGEWVSFHCHVGHAYAPEVLLGQKSEELEAALWTCVRLLTEKATLTQQLAARTAARGDSDIASRIAEQARLDEHYSQLIRDLVEASPNPISQSLVVAEALARSG
jgi:two-component system chemotaxis response regulator CheB